ASRPRERAVVVGLPAPGDELPELEGDRRRNVRGRRPARTRADRKRQRGAGVEPVTTRPAPRPTDDSAAYWDAVARHELVAQRCNACGKLRHPPRPMCPLWHSLEWHAHRLAGTVMLYSYEYQDVQCSTLIDFTSMA